jgi:hypothetical protein
VLLCYCVIVLLSFNPLLLLSYSTPLPQLPRSLLSQDGGVGGRQEDGGEEPGRCHVIELDKIRLFIYIPWTKYGLLTLFTYTLTGLFTI